MEKKFIQNNYKITFAKLNGNVTCDKKNFHLSDSNIMSIYDKITRLKCNVIMKPKNNNLPII